MKYVLEVLFPYIFLLYVFDCIIWVKARHVLLTSCFGNKFELKGSGVSLAGLLPISQAVISHNLPLFYTRDGIYAAFDRSGSNSRIDKAEDFTFIPYKDLARIEVEGKNIKFNNSHTLKTPSSPCARYYAKLINAIKTSSPADREAIINDGLSDSYDLDAVKKIATSSSKPFTIIKIISSYLFVLVFVVLPAALFSHFSKYINLNAVVICMLLIYFLLVFVSFLTLKKLYPSENDLRSHILLSIIFAPINAIRVLSYLTRDLYFRFNYLTVAAHFMPRDAFNELARKEIVLMEYFENEIERTDWLGYWRLKKKLLQGLLDQCEISLQQILTAPEKQDQTAVYYCPFCKTEYRQKRHDCVDCEIALKEFDSGKRAISVDAAHSY
jgi:hypothetical protein